MGRDTIQLEDVVSTISGEYLLEFTSEYGIPEGLHPEFPSPEETIVDFPNELEQSILLGGREDIPYRRGVAHKRPKGWDATSSSYSSVDMTTLNACRTPIQKQPEVLLCLVELSRNYFMGDDVYPTFLYDDDREMDLFNLISALNPLKVKTEVRPRVTHEVPLLTVTASCVIEMEDTSVASESSGTPSVLKKSPLDFADEDPPQTIAEKVGTEGQVQDELSREIPSVGHATTAEVAPETGLEEEVATMRPPVNKRRKQMSHKRVNDEAEANAPPKVLRKDHVSSPTHSAYRGKSLAAMGLGAGSISFAPAAHGAPTAAKSVSDPDPLSYAKPQPYPEQDIAHKYNINLARQVAMGSQLRLRFEQEVRLLKKARAKIARRDQRIQVWDEEIKKLDQEIQSLRSVDAEVYGFRNQTKNLKTLLEAEVDMKKVAEAKNVELAKELDSLRVQFSDLQVSNDQLSQQVSNLQAQVTGKERIKATFEEFKKYEDDRVEQRCAEMDTRLDALSIDFDEKLYPHILTAIVGRRWVTRHGLRLAVLKCAEYIELRQAFVDVVSARIAKGMSKGLKHGVEHGKAKLDLAAIKAYDPEVETKYVTTLHTLKNLKYPLVDQLEKLKDAPIDLIMASLYLESDSREDAPQWIRELRPNSSQLKIHVYPEKKKCRVMCRTHRVSFAHHARSDGIPVSVPTVAPQGLVILLVDAATQTEISEASPRLLRSKSLPPMYNLVWS
ncbi:hypothetical protein Tco_0361300 [Tanacetum coccineum]